MFQHKQDGIVKCLAYTFMSKCMLKKGLKCNVSHGGIAPMAHGRKYYKMLLYSLQAGASLYSSCKIQP